ncbi:hypothetical protein HK097_001152 [Rhizophlyctis rosea]|uniref:Uncharacterized protein n=1 Tax=Rhizophlyctis rosea TaxID=64517 RepID=A0AAD5SJF6_9FUNG|nr:hypothetical protein HK097_001152 [Rhizophlyctis rosea]
MSEIVRDLFAFLDKAYVKHDLKADLLTNLRAVIRTDFIEPMEVQFLQTFQMIDSGAMTVDGGLLKQMLTAMTALKPDCAYLSPNLFKTLLGNVRNLEDAQSRFEQLQRSQDLRRSQGAASGMAGQGTKRHAGDAGIMDESAAKRAAS